MKQHPNRDAHVSMLAMRVQQGEQHLANELFTEIIPDMNRYLRRRIRIAADVEDAIQDIQFKILTVLRKGLYRKGNFFALLFRMMQTYVNLYFKKRRLKFTDAENADVADNGKEEAMMQEEVMQEVDAALNSVPPQRRYVLVEHYMYDRKHKDIGSEMGKGASEVSSACSKGMSDLFDSLTGTARGMALRYRQKKNFAGKDAKHIPAVSI
jgi:RNA polymerase sigma factor (sigma-70 family)